MTTHVMLDLETVGTRPGSTILSIGAVEFGPTGIGPAEFHVIINRRSCKNAGLVEDDDTVAWWDRQTPDARRTLDAATAGKPLETMPLAMALASFDTWLNRGLGGDVAVYGNGASFDNALLAEAYIRTGHAPAWHYRRDRCYRTLAALSPQITANRVGTYHNALDDAKTQAEHLVRILNASALVW